MKNCKETLNNLETYSLLRNENIDFYNLEQHLNGCAECKIKFEKMYKYDLKMKSLFHAIDVPVNLKEDIISNIKFGKKKRSTSLFRLPTIAASIIIIALFIINPFQKKITIDEIIADSIKNHNKNMQVHYVKKTGSKKISAWFKNKLDYAVKTPEFASDVKFIGARLCKICNNKVAYLFFEKKNKRISLYILNNEKFKFESGKRIVEMADKTVIVWSKGATGYSLVTDLSINEMGNLFK